MNGEKQKESVQNRIENVAKKLFGYDEDSLLAEFEAAAREAQECNNKGSLRAESGLEELKTRLQELDIQPIYQVEYQVGNGAEDSEMAAKTPAHLKWTKRVIFIAAVMGVLLIGGGIVSLGKRSLKFWNREIGNSQPKVVWNNVEEALGGVTVEEAYLQIEENLGIRAMQLKYIPAGMEYQEILFEDDYAILKFSYEGKTITFMQRALPVEKSVVITGDRQIYDIIENYGMNCEITFSRNELENGQVEYQGDLVVQDAMYILQGTMSEEEFCKILENLFY